MRASSTAATGSAQPEGRAGGTGEAAGPRKAGAAAGWAGGARQLERSDVVGIAQVAARPRQVERAAAAGARAHLGHLARARVEPAAPAGQAVQHRLRASAPAPLMHLLLPPEALGLRGQHTQQGAEPAASTVRMSVTGALSHHRSACVAWSSF